MKDELLIAKIGTVTKNLNDMAKDLDNQQAVSFDHVLLMMKLIDVLDTQLHKLVNLKRHPQSPRAFFA